MSKEPLPSHHFLLEASAGTGKTFAIENIFVRILIEGIEQSSLTIYPTINQIAVMTFTRAAAAELKFRIRTRLSSVHDILLSHIFHGSLDEKAPDYIKDLVSKGRSVALAAIQRIEMALTHFNDNKITTIHGFCTQLLTELALPLNLSLDSANLQSILAPDEFKSIIIEALHTFLDSSSMEPEIFNHLLNSPSYRGDFSNLIDHLYSILSCAAPIVLSDSIDPIKTLSDFEVEWKKLGSIATVNPETILCHLQGSSNRSNELKQEYIALAQWLKRIFEKPATRTDLTTASASIKSSFYKTSIKKRPLKLMSDIELQACELLVHNLLPLISELFNRDQLFAKLAKNLQLIINPILESKEAILFDTLVDLIYQNRTSHAVKQYLHKEVLACIIDEFQDTDAKQWDIFQSIFLNSPWMGRLVLVGDPKQSIYRFRGADIYTYLNAQRALGRNSKASLTHNWRSHPKMVEAINFLFDESSAPNLFHLPSQNTSLRAPKLTAGNTELEWPIKSYSQPLHFIIPVSKKISSTASIYNATSTSILPFILNEIIKLHEVDKIALHHMAILVKNKQEGMLVEQALASAKIPFVPLKRAPIFESPAYELLRNTLNAVNLKSIRSMKQLLLSTLFSLTNQSHKLLESALSDQPKLWTHLSKQLLECSTALKAHGLGAMVESLLYQTSWLSQEPIGYSLRSKSDLQDLESLLEVVSGETTSKDPLEILNLLKDLKQNKLVDNTASSAPQENHVQLYTLHGCKGLEFQVVFALGVAQRSPAKKTEFVLSNNQNQQEQRWAKEGGQLFLEHLNDLEAEKLRLFYVALTRAKYLLYMPFFFYDDKPRPIKMGQASPLELYLAKSQASGSSTEGLYNSINNGSAIPFYTHISSKPNITYIHKLEGTCSYIKPLEQKANKIQLFESPPKLIFPSYQTLSFSTLKIDKKLRPVMSSFDGSRVAMLPKGPLFGTFIHQIFEEIPFDILRDQKADKPPTEAIENYIYDQLRYTPFLEHKEAILERVHTTVTSPLFPPEDPSIALCDLEAQSFIREPHFIYQNSQSNDRMQGYIDAIILIDKTVYVVDWKTNDNGPFYQAYSKKALSELMHHHHYDLQAQIYQNAVSKILQMEFFQDYRLGGAIYIFIRGIQKDGSSGIYHNKNSYKEVMS